MLFVLVSGFLNCRKPVFKEGNMIPLFASPHLSFLANMLGFRLGTYHRVHRSAGLMSSALLPFHILSVAVQRTSLPLSVLEHLY